MLFYLLLSVTQKPPNSIMSEAAGGGGGTPTFVNPHNTRTILSQVKEMSNKISKKIIIHHATSRNASITTCSPTSSHNSTYLHC